MQRGKKRAGKSGIPCLDNYVQFCILNVNRPVFLIVIYPLVVSLHLLWTGLQPTEGRRPLQP